MKNIKYNKFTISILLVLFMAVSSCEVVDLTPANLVPEEEAFVSAARIEGTVLGVYEAAQRGFFNNVVDRGYPFGAANVQQGDLRGEDMYNDQLFYEITYTNAHGINTANNNGHWIAIYRLINRINVVLKGLDGAVENDVISDEQRGIYRGELLFIRALAHHELLIHFARPFSDDPSYPGVPYRTMSIDDVSLVGEGLEVGRGTIAEDYASMLQDLDEAEQLLPVEEGANPFRVRHGAVIALKTRIKLHQQDWAGVISEYEKIADLYDLTPTPDGPFGTGNSIENVFSFLHSAESNPNVNGALPQMYGDPALGGRGLVKISPVIWNADFWLEEDLRRSLLASVNTAQGVFTNKYVDQATNSDPNPIIRFSEVLLNAAEAHAREGNTGDALELLNRVRSRSLPDGAAEIEEGANLTEAIFNERRIEFLAEGRRWADIHRLSGEGLMEGIPPKAQSRSVTSLEYYTGEEQVTLDHSLPYESPLFVWPIPQPEVINNPTLAAEQNPGY